MLARRVGSVAMRAGDSTSEGKDCRTRVRPAPQIIGIVASQQNQAVSILVKAKSPKMRIELHRSVPSFAFERQQAGMRENISEPPGEYSSPRCSRGAWRGGRRT